MEADHKILEGKYNAVLSKKLELEQTLKLERQERKMELEKQDDAHQNEMARHEEEVVRSMKHKIMKMEEKIKMKTAMGPSVTVNPASPMKADSIVSRGVTFTQPEGPIVSGVVVGASNSPAKLTLSPNKLGGVQHPNSNSTRYHSMATGSGVASTNKWGENVQVFKKTMYSSH